MGKRDIYIYIIKCYQMDYIVCAFALRTTLDPRSIIRRRASPIGSYMDRMVVRCIQHTCAETTFDNIIRVVKCGLLDEFSSELFL